MIAVMKGVEFLAVLTCSCTPRTSGGHDITQGLYCIRFIATVNTLYIYVYIYTHIGNTTRTIEDSKYIFF